MQIGYIYWQLSPSYCGLGILESRLNILDRHKKGQSQADASVICQHMQLLSHKKWRQECSHPWLNARQFTWAKYGCKQKLSWAIAGWNRTWAMQAEGFDHEPCRLKASRWSSWKASMSHCRLFSFSQESLPFSPSSGCPCLQLWKVLIFFTFFILLLLLFWYLPLASYFLFIACFSWSQSFSR